MDKDEILARSRKENKGGDFVEAEVLARANSIALGVGIIASGLLSVLHAIFLDKPDYSVWIVMWAALSSVFFFKYHRLRKRHELLLGLVYLGFCIFFFVLYLRQLLGVG